MRCNSKLDLDVITNYVKLELAVHPNALDERVKAKILEKALENLKKYGTSALVILKKIRAKIDSCDHCKTELIVISSYIERNVRNGYCLVSTLFRKDIENYTAWTYIKSLFGDKAIDIRILRNNLDKFGKSDADIENHFESGLKLCEHCQDIKKETIAEIAKKAGASLDN